MSTADTAGKQPVALEDLIALNDEIAALVRAGLPLELGLQSLGTSLRGRLARVAEQLAVQMSRGASLPEALAAEPHQFPRVYRAVVDAGLKAGRLPEALESLAAFARSLLELRRRIGLALLYPMLVVVVAYALLLAFIGVMVPHFEQTYLFIIDQTPKAELGEFSAQFTHRWLSLLHRLHASVRYWGPIPPAIFGLAVLVWFTSKRSFLGTSVLKLPLLRLVGWVGSGGWLLWLDHIFANFRLANFADLLALLVDHQIPLHEAIALAGDATGDAAIQRETSRIAADLRGGRSFSQSLKPGGPLPRFLCWMMSTGESKGALAPAIAQAAQIYRYRALSQAEWFKVLLPIVLVLVVAGGATLLYALTLFLPMTEVLKGLTVA